MNDLFADSDEGRTSKRARLGVNESDAPTEVDEEAKRRWVDILNLPSVFTDLSGGQRAASSVGELPSIGIFTARRILLHSQNGQS